MPAKSPAQKRLMQAAAHTKGGFGGVPQKVGKEFVSADKRLSKGNSMAKIKKMADGGVASLGGMTSSTPSVPNVPVQPTPDTRDPRKGGYGGQAPVDTGNLVAEGGPIGPASYKKGGQVTTRRVSTGSTSKKSPNW